MFISIQRYGSSWLTRPLVILMFALAAVSLFRPFIQDVRAHGGAKGMLRAGAQPNINAKEYADMEFPVPPVPEQMELTSADALPMPKKISKKSRSV